MLKLAVEKREITGKLDALRKEGKLPAVFYGRKETSTPITLSMKEFEKVWREAGESSIISLEGIDEPKEALIHDVDIDPVTGHPRHADFYVIEKGKKLEVAVPLEFEGIPPAVKDLGGTLVKVLHELLIEALPKDLPHEIVVNVEGLTDFEKHISVKDLALPDGVTALANPDDTVALIAEPKEEEIEEGPTDIDMSAIEVEGEKKEEPTEGGDASEASEE